MYYTNDNLNQFDNQSMGEMLAGLEFLSWN